MTTACCIPAPLNLHAQPPQRWLAGMHRAWAAWRDVSQRRSEWQALEQLGDSTRRDLGLPERGPLVSQRTLWHHERGQW